MNVASSVFSASSSQSLELRLLELRRPSSSQSMASLGIEGCKGKESLYLSRFVFQKFGRMPIVLQGSRFKKPANEFEFQYHRPINFFDPAEQPIKTIISERRVLVGKFSCINLPVKQNLISDI